MAPAPNRPAQPMSSQHQPNGSTHSPPHNDAAPTVGRIHRDRKSTRLNSSHVKISYAVFCLNSTPTPDYYPLSLHDALPISTSGNVKRSGTNTQGRGAVKTKHHGAGPQQAGATHVEPTPTQRLDTQPPTQRCGPNCWPHPQVPFPAAARRRLMDPGLGTQSWPGFPPSV